jgi:hypothetical protein
VQACLRPVQEPLQRASIQPGAGCATSRTVWSFRNTLERHVPGQEIPLGRLVTRPCPEIATKTTRRIAKDECALDPATAMHATSAASAAAGPSFVTVRTTYTMIVSSGMRGLPASPRKRRRILWLGAAALVAAVAAGVVVLIPSSGPPNPEPTVNEGAAQVAAHVPVQISAADRRAIDRTLDLFVPAAVGRKNPSLAWSLAGPELKAGSTLAEWRAGTSPVPSYPVKVQPFHDWSTLDNGKSYVDFTLLVHPRPGASVGSWTFAGQMVKRHGAWLVNRLYTIAIFQPVRGSKHEVGPADFAAPATGASTPQKKSALGSIGLLPIVILLALVPATGLGLGLLALVRASRFRRRVVTAERSRELPPLPSGYSREADKRAKAPAGRS